MRDKIILLVAIVLLVVAGYFSYQYLAESRYLEAEGVVVDVDTQASNITVKTFRGYYSLNIDNVEQYADNDKVTVIFDLGVTETSKDDKVIRIYK